MAVRDEARKPLDQAIAIEPDYQLALALAAWCRDVPKGGTVLCMLPDTGERYLSTPLFADVPADMTEEEMQISRSTPSARLISTGTATPS
jgi:hypothetical protein